MEETAREYQEHQQPSKRKQKMEKTEDDKQQKALFRIEFADMEKPREEPSTLFPEWVTREQQRVQTETNYKASMATKAPAGVLCTLRESMCSIL